MRVRKKAVDAKHVLLLEAEGQIVDAPHWPRALGKVKVRVIVGRRQVAIGRSSHRGHIKQD